MDNSELDPDLQELINEERTVASIRQSNYHQLKLEKGCSAYVRILPVQLGPRKSWFARIARHWVAGKPVFCQKHSAPDFNGDPKAHCALCDLEARYGQDRDKVISDKARRIGAFPKWLIYVYVWEMVDDRNRRTTTTGQDLYVPTEFWITRESYIELANLWERSARLLGSKKGFLDPLIGYDFVISRDMRNVLKIHEDMKGPIMEGKTIEELYDLIDDGMSRVKFPDHTPATTDEMEEAVEKGEDAIFGRRGRDDRGGSSRSRVDTYDDEDRGGGGRGGGGRGGRGESAPAESRGRGGRGESSPPREERRESAPAESRGREEAPPRESRGGRGESAPAESHGGRGGRGESAPAESRGRTEPPQRESRREEPPRERRDGEGAPASRGSNPADFEATAETPPPVSTRSRGTSSADVLPPRTRSAPPPLPERGGRTDDPKAEEEPPRERRDAAPPADTDPATLPASEAKVAPAIAQSRLSENLRSRVSRFSPRDTT